MFAILFRRARSTSDRTRVDGMIGFWIVLPRSFRPHYGLSDLHEARLCAGTPVDCAGDYVHRR